MRTVFKNQNWTILSGINDFGEAEVILCSRARGECRTVEYDGSQPELPPHTPEYIKGKVLAGYRLASPRNAT